MKKRLSPLFEVLSYGTFAALCVQPLSATELTYGAGDEGRIHFNADAAIFDIEDQVGSFVWRDLVLSDLDGAKNKMFLGEDNILTLYKANGESVGLVLNPETGKITLNGSNAGIFFGSNTLPTISAGTGGKAVFGSGLEVSAGQLAVAATTSSTNSTTGALVVSGGIGVAKDSFVNGVKVGRGTGNVATNTALGLDAINGNTSGWANSGFGVGTLRTNQHGHTNTALGAYVLYYSTSTNENTAAGAYAMHWTTSGSSNSAFGKSSLQNTRTGDANSALGSYALHLSTTGGYNVAVGANALYSNLASFNTAVGFLSQAAGTGGNSNASLGAYTLENNTMGTMNVAIGTHAGKYQGSIGTTGLTDPENSIYIGASSRGFSNADNYSIVIGADAVGAGANTTVIGSPSTTHTHLKGKTMSHSLEVASTAEFKGQVILTAPQGDISMGDYE